MVIEPRAQIASASRRESPVNGRGEVTMLRLWVQTRVRAEAIHELFEEYCSSKTSTPTSARATGLASTSTRKGVDVEGRGRTARSIPGMGKGTYCTEGHTGHIRARLARWYVTYPAEHQVPNPRLSSHRPPQGTASLHGTRSCILGDRDSGHSLGGSEQESG